MAHVLVVDDNESLRELYEMELRDEGHEITLAEDGYKALQCMADCRPDLILLDVAMPKMDGLQCMREIRNKHEAVPIILHTAFAHFEKDPLTYSANAYVVKSGDLTELKARIRELLNVFNASV
jgi:DNA-binding response OmpR family regulator